MGRQTRELGARQKSVPAWAASPLPLLCLLRCALSTLSSLLAKPPAPYSQAPIAPFSPWLQAPPPDTRPHPLLSLTVLYRPLAKGPARSPVSANCPYRPLAPSPAPPLRSRPKPRLLVPPGALQSPAPSVAHCSGYPRPPPAPPQPPAALTAPCNAAGEGRAPFQGAALRGPDTTSGDGGPSGPNLPSRGGRESRGQHYTGTLGRKYLRGASAHALRPAS